MGKGMATNARMGQVRFRYTDGVGMATNARMGHVKFRYTDGEENGHECTNGTGKIQVYEWGRG